MHTTDLDLRTRFSAPRYEYHHADGRVLPNDEARAVQAFAEAVRTLQRRVEQSFVGAVVARVLSDHPWLQSFRLIAYDTTEYDDRGSFYARPNVTVGGVAAAHGAALPDGLRDDDGTLREDDAEEFLRNELCDDESQIYRALIDNPEDVEEVTLRVDRSALAELLAAPVIDGAAIFKRLTIEPK